MNNIEDDINAAEQEWDRSSPALKTELPETGLAIKADKIFEEQIIPISAIEKRRTELGVENAALATREQRASLATVNGLCRKVNGQVEKVRKFLVEDAVRVQKVCNTRAKDIKAEVAKIQKPILDKFAEWDAEDEAAAQAIIDAEQRIEREAQEARHAAERQRQEAERQRLEEANKALLVQRETERLEREKEREAFAAERRKIEQAAQIERARIAAEAAEAAKVLADAQRVTEAKAAAEREKFEKEKREFEAQKALAEKLERNRLAKIAAEETAKAKAEADRIAAEEAEKQRIALEAAERFQREQAAEKERLRLEAIEPDKPKIHRLASAINLTEATAPDVTSDDAKEIVRWAREHLKRIAKTLLDFPTPKETK
jgi:hypothetical protein